METSGGARKTKPSDYKDLADLGSPPPQRPSRSLFKRIVTAGKHSGLPMVSGSRPKKFDLFLLPLWLLKLLP